MQIDFILLSVIRQKMDNIYGKLKIYEQYM